MSCILLGFVQKSKDWEEYIKRVTYNDFRVESGFWEKVPLRIMV